MNSPLSDKWQVQSVVTTFFTVQLNAHHKKFCPIPGAVTVICSYVFCLFIDTDKKETKEHTWLTVFTESEATKFHVIVVCGISIVLDQSYSLLHSIHSVNTSDFHADILLSHVLRPSSEKLCLHSLSHLFSFTLQSMEISAAWSVSYCRIINQKKELENAQGVINILHFAEMWINNSVKAC